MYKWLKKVYEKNEEKIVLKLLVHGQEFLGQKKYEEVIEKVRIGLENKSISYLKTIKEKISSKKDERYSILLKVIEDVINKKTLEYEKESAEFHKRQLEIHYEDYPGEKGAEKMRKILWNQNGEMKDFAYKFDILDDELQEYSFKAKIISKEDWTSIKEAQQESAKGLAEEGDEFEVFFNPKAGEVCLLNVNEPIEISGEYEVDKNKIMYDIDVWGTQLGVRAQKIYAYYVKELDKYCLVNHTYWSL